MSSDPVPFLDETTLVRYAIEVDLPVDYLQPLLALAGRIASDPRLKGLALSVHRAVFEGDGDASAIAERVDRAFGRDADALHALFAIDSMRLVRERQAARGVAAEIGLAVNRRHAGAWMREAAERGEVGLADGRSGWLRTVASGHLYRLGRLEFAVEAWSYPTGCTATPTAASWSSSRSPACASPRRVRSWGSRPGTPCSRRAPTP